METRTTASHSLVAPNHIKYHIEFTKTHHFHIKYQNLYLPTLPLDAYGNAYGVSPLDISPTCNENIALFKLEKNTSTLLIV